MSTLSGWDHTLGSMVYSSLAGNPSQAELPTALLGQKGSPAELCTSGSLLGPTACRSLVHPELSTRCPLCLYLIPMARLCRFSQRSPGGETQVGLLGSSDTRGMSTLGSLLPLEKPQLAWERGSVVTSHSS